MPFDGKFLQQVYKDINARLEGGVDPILRKRTQDIAKEGGADFLLDMVFKYAKIELKQSIEQQNTENVRQLADFIASLLMNKMTERLIFLILISSLQLGYEVRVAEEEIEKLGNIK